MRPTAFRSGALFFILAISSAFAAYAQQPGLSPGSLEETTSADLDGDGIPQNLEFQLARHFFPWIWYDSGEDTSAPGGNHNHREQQQPGRLLFRVRRHPQSPSHIAMTYALLYRVDGGEGYFGTTLACHPGDVEPFAITLKPNPSCALGYSMDWIETWAHGVHSTGQRQANGCNWTDTVLASENKHGNYLSEAKCDFSLFGGAENCDTDWTAGDVNAWTGLNVGERSAPAPLVVQRHDDLSPLGFSERTWTSGSFCGTPHSAADLAELFLSCQLPLACPAAPQSKFTDDFVAPYTPIPSPPGGYAGCFTDDPNRALPAGLGTVGDIGTCVNIARASGFAYAGLQWYGHCFGGNELRYSQVGDAECNTPCPSGQMCGGAWRNSIYATGYSPPTPGSGMQPDSAVRGCSNWTWWAPVHKPDAASCRAYCVQNSANACEWFANGDCYVEFGSGCQVQGGFPGWSAAVF
ncbi:MAG TPA: WSC domain-containing protein [Steroidobacteraceae bacterium]|nr:WSC domain-containing protein [Steroidobacteraceae bacterium]